LGGEVLSARDHLVGSHWRQLGTDGLEAGGVGNVGGARSFQVDEVPQSRLAERQQPQLDARRVAPRVVG
jgi:hypothetical protein